MKISERIDNVVEGFKKAKLPINRKGALQIILGTCGSHISILKSICEELGIEFKDELLQKISNIIPKKELEETLMLAANMSDNKNLLLCIVLAAINISDQEQTKKTDTNIIFNRLLHSFNPGYAEKLAKLLKKYKNSNQKINVEGLDLLTIRCCPGTDKEYNVEYLDRYVKRIMNSADLINNQTFSDMHKVVYAPTKEVAEYIELFLGLSENFKVQPPMAKELREILIVKLYELRKLPQYNELTGDIEKTSWNNNQRPTVTEYTREPEIAFPVAMMSSDPSKIFAAKDGTGTPYEVVVNEGADISPNETPADVVKRLTKALKSNY